MKLNTKNKCIIATLGWLFAFNSVAQTWNNTGAKHYNTLRAKDMITYNGKLYMSIADSKITGYHLYYFDEQKWDSTSSAMRLGYPEGYAVWNSKLYCGGNFQEAGGLNGSGGIASWDGNNWSVLGSGTSGGTQAVNCIASYKNELYVGGNFTTMGGVNVSRIARWDGVQWKDVGGGVKGSITYVTAMTVYKNELYVGGNFYTAGNKPAYYIARWDGAKWDSVGTGLDGLVNCMTVDTVKDILYVGGGFFTAGDSAVWYIAQWDGAHWKAPGKAITTGVLCMSMFNNELYVGGGMSDTALARWDGNQWYNVPGPNSGVDALQVYNNNLYVAGPFTNINGDNTIQKLACYGNSCPQNVGIAEQLAIGNRQFTVFPNPSNKQVTIKINSLPTSKPYELTIINNIGQEVYKAKITAELNINTEKFSKGMYNVNVCDSEGHCSSEKMIVE